MRNDVPLNDSSTHEEMPRDIKRLQSFYRRVKKIMETTKNKFVLRNLRLISIMLKLGKKTAEIIREKSAPQPNEKKLIRLKKQLQLWIFTAENGVETQMDGSYLYTMADELIGRK